MQTVLRTLALLALRIALLVSILSSAKLARMAFSSFLPLTAAFYRVPLSIIQVLGIAIVARLLASNASHRLNAFPVRDYFSSTTLAFQFARAQLMVILH